jgi:hypothetical protein
MSETELYNALENARKDLEKHVKGYAGKSGGDFCSRYAVEVLKDSKVQAAFVKHISNNEEDFRELTCHPFGIDGVEVVFRFQCRPPKICIIAPAFAVQYDPMTKTVGQITDPYFDGIFF